MRLRCRLVEDARTTSGGEGRGGVMSGNYGEERVAQASVIQPRHWSREEAEHAGRLALLVVRAGARDSLGWWEDEALTEAGAFALRRIFPRDPRRVAGGVAVWAA